MSVTPNSSIINVVSSGKTINLPQASLFPGREYIIRNGTNAPNTITITPNGVDIIDNGLTAISLPFESVKLVSNGISKWNIVSRYTAGLPIV